MGEVICVWNRNPGEQSGTTRTDEVPDSQATRLHPMMLQAAHPGHGDEARLEARALASEVKERLA